MRATAWWNATGSYGALGQADTAEAGEAFMQVANLTVEQMAAGLNTAEGLAGLYETRAKGLSRRGHPAAGQFEQAASELKQQPAGPVLAVLVPIVDDGAAEVVAGERVFFSVVLDEDCERVLACVRRTDQP